MSTNVLDDTINAIVEAESDEEENYTDEFERWRANEPRWSREDFDTQGNPVPYWLTQRSKYPALSQLAIDIMTIPASSCECDQFFRTWRSVAAETSPNWSSAIGCSTVCTTLDWSRFDE